MEEVYPGIFRITECGKFSALKPPVNIYVLPGKNGLIYDSGYGNSGCIKKFIAQFNEIRDICIGRGEEFRIERILLSHAHPDHFAGLKRLRRKLGVKVIITDEMHQRIKSSSDYRTSYQNYTKDVSSPVKLLRHILYRLFRNIEHQLYSLYWGISYMDNPDVIIEPDSSIDINGERWEIFSSPGHSSDHITLFNNKKGLLFSGDNILDGINVWLGPPKSDLDQYEDSLRKILKLKGVKMIFPAHGNPLLKPYDRIREILEWRKKRSEDVLYILKETDNRGITVNETAICLYPGDSKMKRGFAAGWIELTLEKFVKTGVAAKAGNRYYYRI